MPRAGANRPREPWPPVRAPAVRDVTLEHALHSRTSPKTSRARSSRRTTLPTTGRAPSSRAGRPPAGHDHPRRRRRRRRSRHRARSRDGLRARDPSGGHSPAGHSVSDGGIVLDLSAMRGARDRRRGRTAWAETGLTAGEYTAAAGEHGLATGFGDAGSVGLGGITLAGGVGFLVRKHGLTIDDLLAAEIVTADGELLRVDAEQPPRPLLGAPRRRRELRRRHAAAVPAPRGRHDRRRDAVPPRDPGRDRRIHRRGRGRARGALDDRERHARSSAPVPGARAPRPAVMMATLVYAGDVDAGERAVAPFRALATRSRTWSGRCRIRRCIRRTTRTSAPSRRPHEFAEASSSGTRRRSRAHRGSTAPMAVVQLRVLGGAMARVPADATAFAHRERRIMGNVVAMYERPRGAARARGLGRRPRRRAERRRRRAPTSASSATRARSGSAPPTRGDLGAAGGRQGRVRPRQRLRLNQNIPPA